MTTPMKPVPWERLESLTLPDDHALLHAWLGERLTGPRPTLEALLGTAPRLSMLRLTADPSDWAAPGRGDLLLRLQVAAGGAVLLRLGGDLVRALLARLEEPPGTPAAPLPVTPEEAGLLAALVAAGLADLAGGAAALDDVWVPDPSDPRGRAPDAAPADPARSRDASSARTPHPAAAPPALVCATRWTVGAAPTDAPDHGPGGWLQAALDAGALDALRRAARVTPPPVAAARAKGVPLAFDVVAAEAPCPAAEAAALAVGDVFAFPHCPPAGEGRVTGWLACEGWRHAMRLERTPSGRQLTLLEEEIPMPPSDLDGPHHPGRAPGASPASPGVTSPGRPGPGAHPPGGTHAARLEQLPVLLSVTLGRVTLSAADVTRLTPGAVIELQEPLGGPVELCAGGRPIARGELVAVDGALGVRLTALLP